MLGELNETQKMNLLCSQVVGRLACTNGLQPYIIPVTYTYDGRYIYGQTNEGQKLNTLRKNPLVCFEIDSMTDMRNWQSLIVYGRFEELKGKLAEKARALLFKNVYPLMTSSTINLYGHATNGKVDDSTRIKQVMYRIRIKRTSGRYEKQ